jgi:UDP-2,3-diacylglucosamine pyrophosphatase LpxH
VLRREDSRQALVAEVARCDRLVLLGDVFELRHGPVHEALGASQQTIRDLADALSPGHPIIIVPGNHDHLLLGPWLGRRSRGGPAPPMGLAADVDWRAGQPLATVIRWLAPADVRVTYPGVWLRDDVYATHGHYCDRHTTVPILERLGAGLMALVNPEPPGGPVEAEDYEGTLAPMYAWIDSVAQWRAPQRASRHSIQVRAWRELSGPNDNGRVRAAAMRVGFPAAIAALNRARIGPLRSDVSGVELRRAALSAFGEVVRRLGVDAQHVIFGHTHRAGPLPGDDRSEWLAPSGASLLNTGSWVHEPGFLGPEPGTSPYRPGFAAVVEDDGEPELVNLLDPA